jgi:MFS transporter, DHA2 family, multidrug resistance protein
MTSQTAAATGALGPAAAAPSQTPIPWLGVASVLLGAFISTLTGRLSTFGLADIRGAVHAGFDDGAWITTAQTTAQMLVTPFALWAGTIYGPRRILLTACATFAVAEILVPFSENLSTLLLLQFVSGLGSGCFIPLTLSFILLRMPRKLWTYGVALYALHIELSTHISASIEGWYIDHASWRWIFWQNVPLAIGMAACLHFGVRTEPRRDSPINVDAFGLAAFGVGLALIYAALDQGNRLDWLNSGLVWGLLSGGAVLLAAFFVQTSRSRNSWLDLRVAFALPLPLLFLAISLLRSSILSTTFLVPQFLSAVRGFRELNVGDALLWVGLPQLILCPLSGFLLRFVDPRLNAALGMCCIGCACLMVAYGLTPLWGSDQFLPSQLLQAVGQSMAFTGVVFNGVLNIRLESALTFGAMLQTARLLGGEAGQAFTATFQRIREQRASNLIGLHLQAGAGEVVHRLQAYGHVIARGTHWDGNGVASASILARVVRSMATTQSVIDCYVAMAAVVLMGLVVLATLKAPPGAPPPLTHLLFGKRLRAA